MFGVREPPVRSVVCDDAYEQMILAVRSKVDPNDAIPIAEQHEADAAADESDDGQGASKGSPPVFGLRGYWPVENSFQGRVPVSALIRSFLETPGSSISPRCHSAHRLLNVQPQKLFPIVAQCAVPTRRSYADDRRRRRRRPDALSTDLCRFPNIIPPRMSALST